MTQQYSVELTSHSENETGELANQIAPWLQAGDVVLLHGQIGAGKSHFARCLIQNRLSKAGLYEDVPSPTFTIVQTYFDGDVEIWHADLYRLTDPTELIELGLEIAFDTGICLIEWPDRLGELTPEGTLSIIFEHIDDEFSRKISISSQNQKFQKLIEEIGHKPKKSPND